jgi:alkylation response protein AidB-like acyl-CoA dehydrogenase
MDADSKQRRDAELVARARAVGGTLAGHAGRHDVDGTLVVEGIAAFVDAGLARLAVPAELGGDGATGRELALVQRELAHHCGSTALATAMHQHVVCATAWRHRRGLPGAEALLRRVAGGDLVVTTGGADFTRPRGMATRVEGGFRVSGRKSFASLSPAGALISTLFPFDDPDRGRRVLSTVVERSAPGVTVLDNWDALGMRGTGSGDVVFDEVFVADGDVVADRPFGVIDPPLQLVVAIAAPIIAATYLGVAEAAHRAALDLVGERADDVLVQRQIGLMAHRLTVAGWALDGALTEVGDDPQPCVAGLAAALAAKREVALAGVEVCDLAMEVVGGPAFARGTTIERCYRDIRAAKFHPLTPEVSLVHAGRMALGLPVDDL